MAKVCIVDNLLDADVRVWKAPITFMADAKVYLTEDEELAKNRGSIWQIVEDADDPAVTKVYYTPQEFGCDLKISFVDEPNEAQWNSRNPWGNRMKYKEEDLKKLAEQTDETGKKKYRPAKIYVVGSRFDADVIAAKVPTFFDADVCAYVPTEEEGDKFDYRGNEIWHYTDDPDDPEAVRLFWSKVAYQEQLKVFFVDNAVDARWCNPNNNWYFHLSK